MERTAIRERLDSRDQSETRDHSVLQDPVDHSAHQAASSKSTDQPVLWELQDHPGQPARRDHQESMAPTPAELPAHQETMDHQDHLELQDLRDRPDLRDHLASLARASTAHHLALLQAIKLELLHRLLRHHHPKHLL